MEKIKFNNGLELELTPMGISKSNDNLTVSVIASIGYEELEGVISDYSNIMKIEMIGQSGEVISTFNDCIKYTQLSKIKGAYKNESEEVFDIFVITFNCNEIQGILSGLNLEIESLKINNQELVEQNQMLTECILEISELLYV